MLIDGDGKFLDQNGGAWDSPVYAEQRNDYLNGKSTSSTPTVYSTPTGQTFNNKADAEKYVREQAEWQAEWEKNLNAAIAKDAAVFKEELQELLKHGSEMQTLSNQGWACYQRKDWDGAITAWAKTTSTINSQQWKQYEQQYRNFLNKSKLDDKEEKAETWLSRWKTLCAEDQKWLSLAYSRRGNKKSEAGDIDGGINDQKTAVINYPFNDDFRNSLMETLGVIYSIRGSKHKKNEDLDHAIADLSIAVKLLPKNHEIYKEVCKDLAISYGSRCMDRYVAMSKIADKEEQQRKANFAFSDFRVFLEFYSDDLPDELKGVKSTLIKKHPGVENRPIEEDPAVQKLFAELNKSPAVSMPKSVIVSNDTRKNEMPQAIKQSIRTPTNAQRPQTSTPSSSASPSSSSSSSYSSSSSSSSYRPTKKSGAGKKIIIAIIAIIVIFIAVPKVKGLFSKPKPKTATTQTATATANANVNFRTEPSTNGNIIRQLKQDDTVTLTGETSGGWTQIKHGNDTGWVSTEFLTQGTTANTRTTQTATETAPAVNYPPIDPSQLIGTWTDTDNNTWTFNANGSLRFTADGTYHTLTYTITGSKLEFAPRGNDQSYNVLVSPDGSTITLKDGKRYAMSETRGIERAENTLTKQ